MRLDVEVEGNRRYLPDSGIRQKTGFGLIQNMKRVTVTVPLKVSNMCRQNAGLSRKVMLQRIRDVLLAIPKVDHTRFWRNGIEVYWPRDPPDNEGYRDPTQGLIDRALINITNDWERCQGAVSLQRQLLRALENPTYKLHACIYDAAVHGHADTLQTLEWLEEWWQSEFDF